MKLLVCVSVSPRGWEVSLVLYPSTAEDSVSQFVRLTLSLTLDGQYPSSSPVISIHNPRGLSDEKLSSVKRSLQLEAQSCLGSPVLYQLIEKAKEILTDSNIPHGNCVICLYDFKEGEAFTKTSCYHYFHCHCLGRYASHSESELRQREKELEEDKTRERTDDKELTVVCPVCREPLMYDVDHLLSSPAPQLPELDEAVIGATFQQKWSELQKLLERQRAKGGIIDPEVESNRFLIHINETAAEDGDQDVDASAGVPPASTPSESCDAQRDVPGASHCRGGSAPKRQNAARGYRRGGRPRPQHRRVPPVTEHLDKLSLSSDCSQEPVQGLARGHRGDATRPAGAERCEEGVSKQPETPLAEDSQLTQQPQCASEGLPEDSAPPAGSHGHRGRRRGPHRPSLHTLGPGPTHYHWDPRPPRSRGGGANGLYHRGRGPRRGIHHRVVDREGGAGEVL